MPWLPRSVPTAGAVVATATRWITTVGPWWAASVAGHLALLVLVGLIAGTVHVATRIGPTRTFDNAIVAPPPEQLPLDAIRPDEAPLLPTILNTENLLVQGAMSDEAPIDYQVEPTSAGDIGGKTGGNVGELFGRGFDARQLALATSVIGGKPASAGAVTGAGLGGGGGGGFGGRINRTGGIGGTPRSERAVNAALSWFARHQNDTGGWSLGEFNRKCKDATCTGAGNAQSDAAATSFALLPFLAAGQTHKNAGPYQPTIHRGVYWLVTHQAADGNLAAGSKHLMYTHGLAAIALCEAFGMTQDKTVGAAAQAAIHFIKSAQNQEDGGWRYTPGQPGDTSVVGWQLMALKSGQMAGLQVDADVLARAKKFLKSASSKSRDGGLFSYQPDGSPSPTMTGVGLLCSQYTGLDRKAPGMVEGTQFLMRNLPDASQRNSYYWYYATQVMHNLPGPEWDTWNRTMRRTLIDSQVKEGCAAGSWDPLRPVRDSSHAESGGRIMTTSLATLTLEVYYRYLPLYQLDKQDEARARLK